MESFVPLCSMFIAVRFMFHPMVPYEYFMLCPCYLGTSQLDFFHLSFAHRVFDLKIFGAITFRPSVKVS